MTAVTRFIQAMVEEGVPVKEQAVGAVWIQTCDDSDSFIEVPALASALEAAGHAAQNKSRLREQLEADKRVVKRQSGFRISARRRRTRF
jgi:hypothetical protein